jgi:glycosyltransferase involved in cell wall biosynthesis
MHHLKVSVVIPVFNAAATIGLAIEAVLRQDYSGKIDLIIVDDGSTDQTPEILKRWGNDPRVTIVTQPNAGPAAARNKGAARAWGEVILFTDSDCVPHVDWIAKMLSPFVDPGIAAVAGSYGIANPQVRLARCVHQEILFRHRRMPFYPRVFGSYNVAIRKKVWEEVGGFDEGFLHASGEDNDLSYQVLAKGWRIYFEKSALVDHFHPVRLRRYLYEQYRHGYWRVRMYRRHPRMSQGDDYTFWKDIAEIALVMAAALSFFSVFFSTWGLLMMGSLFAGLVFIEIKFALLMIKGASDALYFSQVLIYRAFARSWGFVCGGLAFFFPITKLRAFPRNR